MKLTRKAIISWLKKILGVTALEEDNKRLRSIVKGQREFVVGRIADLKEYTRVDADLGVRGNNTIVLTGVYRNQAYVRFYDIGEGEFKRLIEQMASMKDHCLIRHIDQPPSIRGTFKL